MNKKIQILRAIAIIAVLITHTYYTLNKEIELIFFPICGFGVGIFLFLSGYLTKINKKSYKETILKRLKKLLIPYVIWTLVFSFARNNLNIIKNLLLADEPTIFYYIFIYIELTLLTPFIVKLLKSKYWILGFVITPISILITNYLFPFVFSINLGYFKSLNCFQWFIFYYLGMILGSSFKKINISNKKLVICYIVTLIISFLEGYISYKYFPNVNLHESPMRFSMMIYSIVLCLLSYNWLNKGDIKKINKFEKLLIVVGNYSFGIYLSHLFINQILTFIFKHIGLLNYYIFPINFSLVLIFSVMAIFVFRKIFGTKIASYIGF